MIKLLPSCPLILSVLFLLIATCFMYVLYICTVCTLFSFILQKLFQVFKLKSNHVAFPSEPQKVYFFFPKKSFSKIYVTSFSSLFPRPQSDQVECDESLLLQSFGHSLHSRERLIQVGETMRADRTQSCKAALESSACCCFKAHRNVVCLHTL